MRRDCKAEGRTAVCALAGVGGPVPSRIRSHSSCCDGAVSFAVGLVLSLSKDGAGPADADAEGVWRVTAAQDGWARRGCVGEVWGSGGGGSCPCWGWAAKRSRSGSSHWRAEGVGGG